MTPVSPQLALRILVLASVAVIVQIAAISQISVFGVNADLSPLIVMGVGLLCGSVAGAATGFGVGLFIDLALVQTLGVSSLIYVVVGYGAGRLGELRDPQAALAPLAAAAAATATATCGYAVIQFLLGVDSPVSFQLVRQILATIIVNTIIALPVHALVRRWLEPGLPDDPRRRRRRAYTTGGLSPLSRA